MALDSAKSRQTYKLFAVLCAIWYHAVLVFRGWPLSRRGDRQTALKRVDRFPDPALLLRMAGLACLTSPKSQERTGTERINPFSLFS